MIIPLNNSINTSILDYDAREFTRVCGITQSDIIRVINECFKELKNNDLWNSIFYGFAMIYAGSSQSMLVDIKSRQSLVTITPTTGSFLSPTFSNNGIQYNGGVYHAILGTPLSQYPFTKARPAHISIYNRTDYISLGLTVSSKHGHLESFGGMEQSFSFTPTGVSASLWHSTGPVGFTLSNNSGFFIYSNVDNNNNSVSDLSNPYEYYLSRNGQIVGTFSHSSNTHEYGSNICIGAFGDNIFSPSLRSFDEITWYSIGEGADSSSTTGRHIDMIKQEKYFQIVEKLQTILNR